MRRNRNPKNYPLKNDFDNVGTKFRHNPSPISLEQGCGACQNQHAVSAQILKAGNPTAPNIKKFHERRSLQSDVSFSNTTLRGLL